MRLSRNKQRPVFFFKMVDVPSDYVGTEKKIDLIGRFNCVVDELSKKSKSDEKITEKEVVCKLTVPNGYHIKPGFMASLESPEKPDMKVIAVKKFTEHSICELETWK